METFKLILPGHLNHYGYLFGGNLLKWVDEVGWIAASRDFPGAHFVTVAMDNVEFKRSVREGSVLRFAASLHSTGRTSVRYTVEVFGKTIDEKEETRIFTTTIAFVRVDENGNKIPVK